MLHTNRYIERQRAVAQVIRMHLDPEKSRLFLKNEYGIRMGASTLRKYKHELKTLCRERLYHIAEYGSVEEHAEAIDEIEIARRLLWKEYKNAEKPTDRAAILEKIINTRPLLSSYYDSTKEVIEKPVKEDDNIQVTEQRQPTTNDWV